MKKSGISFLKSLKNLLLKMLFGFLYLLKLKKKSPFQDNDENELENNEDAYLTEREKKIKVYERKARFFKHLMFLFWGICIFGFIYSNFLAKKHLNSMADPSKVQILEKIFEESSN
jgi:hypothetical protein